MEKFVVLDRQFVRWTVEEKRDSNEFDYFGDYRSTLSWPEIRERRRVVILAEPGSGKSTEIQAQVRASKAADHYTFTATLQTVGRIGMAGALGVQSAEELEAWRESNEPAWFYLDAVDEAKGSGIHLDDVLRAIADAIHGCRHRAHVFLTGRDANWEIERDLELLIKHLSLPPPDAPKPALDPNQLVINAINRTRDEEEEPARNAQEEPLVVRMMPLDEERVAKFARANHVTDPMGFLDSIHKSNLWAFASRPMDLDWLVDYWQTNGRFGLFAEMLELSICKRLQETDPDRAQRDPLSIDAALAALERIGAALVLQRRRDIEVPDRFSVSNGAMKSLALDTVLPNWSGKDISRLISRAILIPSSAGYVRLHNDNDGIVSGYLAARWINRLINTGGDETVLHNLIFATTYDIPVVIPSMRETAAWLSLWNHEVASKVLDCDPLLLMDAGDPGSLKTDVREKLLRAVIQQVISDKHVRVPNRDALMRFSKPDLEECIRTLWSEYSESEEARELLLAVILRGELTCCADIAIGASFGFYSDRYTPVFAGVALLATADEANKRRYAEYIRDNAATVSQTVLWDAVRDLFPAILSIDELLGILRETDVASSEHGLGLGYYGPRLVDKLTERIQVEELLAGMLSLMEASERPLDQIESARHEEYRSTIEAAACRILELSNDDEAPNISVDAALRLGEIFHYHGRARRSNKRDLLRLLKATPERRRQTLWRAAEMHRHLHSDPAKPLDGIWRFRIFGFSPSFGTSDLDWLIEDAANQRNPFDRQIATDAAMTIWRQNEENPEILERILQVANSDSAAAETVSEWMKPRPSSDEESELQAQIAAQEQVFAIEKEKSDQSWREFADSIRADPGQLRDIAPPANGTVDSRLYSLWRLLDSLGENRSQYAIHDLSPLNPLLGEEAVHALQTAFIGFWRHWQPTLASERPTGEQRNIFHFDCIGLVGITQEAKLNPNWADNLTQEEAILASIYAQNELNGFPSWIDALATNHPEAVRIVMLRALALEIDAVHSGEHFPILSDIARSDKPVAQTVSQDIYEIFLNQNDIAPNALRYILDILVATFDDEAAMIDEATKRFNNATDHGIAANYLAVVYKLTPTNAIQQLVAKFSDLSKSEETALMIAVLSNLFDRWSANPIDTSIISVDDQLTLIRAAYRTVRIEEDNDHSGEGSYTPDYRDDAESARSGLLNALIGTPGRSTYDALNRLADDEELGIPREVLLRHARSRALSDSEHAEWQSQDIVKLEEESMSNNGSQSIGDAISLDALIRAARDAHPHFKYATVVAGMASFVAVFIKLGISLPTLVVGVAILFVFMVLFLVFARAASLSSAKMSLPAQVLVWSILLIPIVSTLLVGASAFFDTPLPIKSFIVRQIGGALDVPLLESPYDNTVYENKSPRLTELTWRESSEATGYLVEVQYQVPTTGKWSELPGFPKKVNTNEHRFIFGGDQPGRWRISALASAGRKSDPSGWRYFRYEWLEH